MSMTSLQLRDVLTRALSALPAHADELRDLDAALGDGDLGITVRSGSEAVVKAIGALPENASVSELLMASGKAFSTANPSTFAALVGGGLLAAAKAMQGKETVEQEEALTIGQAVAARIIERGKSQVGDKTVLDALVPSLDVLQSSTGNAIDTLDAMIATATERVSETAKTQSKKGRAAWTQERSIGHADPGATAYVRFLEALRQAL
jgi:phosphoenolpyruvate---glycerone phosphotransferase subunit DhaL